MAHEDWGTNPGNFNELASLAWVILSDSNGGVNPYPGAQALKGAGNDELWRHLVQGNDRRTTWIHKRIVYDIERSARVPYVVKDHRSAAGGRNHRYLDFLLVGYAAPVPDPDVNAGTVWTPGNPSRLRDLGEFLIEDLRPKTVTELQRTSGWENAVEADPPGAPDYATTTPRQWEFRQTPRTIEKSARIQMIAKLPNGRFKTRYLLVGYEGGGGW